MRSDLTAWRRFNDAFAAVPSARYANGRASGFKPFDAVRQEWLGLAVGAISDPRHAAGIEVAGQG
jgi:hypothetical protein